MCSRRCCGKLVSEHGRARGEPCYISAQEAPMSQNIPPDTSPESIERYRQRARELRENAVRIEDELRALEEKKAELQITLARIRGAVQVLEELIEEASQ